jgi:hypothetical protein
MSLTPSRKGAISCALFSTLAALLATPANAAQFVPDDFVAQGSAAFGIDAVETETFGFDTIRLKENNLRIHFDDTSATAGFPANDWRLIANDTGSGGANYFAIEDTTAGRVPFRVDAGAPADTLRVGSAGRVGIGTADPGLHLELKKSDTPAVRLNQDNSGGFTAQTWDIGGNEANFFIRDLTGGSKLSFRIRPGAPTSSIDIASSGNVGIGTASPAAKLHVAGNALVTGTLEIGSSRSIKDDIRDLSLEDAQTTLAALKPVHFRYKNETEQQLGFIAEDVPDLVATDSRRSLVPMDFVAVLTKVVQQHDARVEELEKELSAKDKAIEALAARLDALERNATTHVATATISEEQRKERQAQRRDQVSPASVVLEEPKLHQEESAEVINNGR